MRDLRVLTVATEVMPPSMAPDIGAATRAAYERWAPHYPPMAHNALMRAEERAMRGLWPAVAGRVVLDLACGTGRYSRLLAQGGAARVVAADFCPAMLRQGVGVSRVCASMMQLPFMADAFDVVICGLALGHADNVVDWMTELARVIKPGGTLLYSDFHPAASRAGLPRTFKDAHGRTLTVPHQRHELAAQRAAAAAAGLTIDAVAELRVGLEVEAPRADDCSDGRGSGARCRWQGLPVVLVVRARR